VPDAEVRAPGPPERLPGGFVAEVVRVGDTVRRTSPARDAYVAGLLTHLHRVGADLAPRHLGRDAHGRQVLSYVEGRVPWRDREDPAYFADAALIGLGGLIRRLHDACAGSPLAAGAETVCHGDLSPKNTVYRDTPDGLLPVAFVDWDRAAPGRRIEDVAFACWHWAESGTGADPVEFARRCRLVCDGYDAAGAAAHAAGTAPHPPGARPLAAGTGPLPAGRRSPDPVTLPRRELVDVMLDQMEGTWRGIAAGAERDEPGMRRLRAAGVVEMVRGWHAWLRRHRPAVRAALAG
jgi:aminoglycoside phosphotransferase (APT) family kinase protein